MMKALIDGDIIARACAHAAEKKVYLMLSSDGEVISEVDDKLSRDMMVRHYGFEYQEVYVSEPVENCLYSVRNMVKSCMDVTGASSATVFLSGPNNYRYDIDPEYKANRKDSHTPSLLQPAKDFLIENYNAVTTQGEEADDAMGIAQCQSEEDTIICTIDKDLDMIPGKHYNWRKGDIYEVTDHDATIFFYTQLLTGDRVDNVKGLVGVGPVRAAKELAGIRKESRLYDKAKRMYKSAGRGEDELIKNARLLWIRREPDQMWTPPVSASARQRTATKSAEDVDAETTKSETGTHTMTDSSTASEGES